MSFISLRAQTNLPYNAMNNMQNEAFSYHHLSNDSNNLQKKWFLSRYSGISTSFGFFNGGSASVLSAPIGLQLNRRLNNNLYAFAGIATAPAFFNFNRSFSNTDVYKNNLGTPRFNNNGFGIYTRAAAGLMYINDDRTFSISGSIGIERSSYPLYQSNRIHTQKLQPVAGSRQ